MSDLERQRLAALATRRRQCYMSEPTVGYPRKYDVFCLNIHVCYIRKCVRSEHVTHEYEMYSARTYVTYRNALCPNICSHENINSRKYDVLCPK